MARRGDGSRNEAHPRRSVFVDENRAREETSPSGRFAPKLVEQVSAALTETGMDLLDLVLQITGSVTKEQWLPAQDIMGALMNPGVTLPIDGFGIGYPSITHFDSFPVDTLRMDRSMDERAYEVAERSRRAKSPRPGRSSRRPRA